MKKILISFLVLGLLTASSLPTTNETKGDWESLFDGETLN